MSNYIRYRSTTIAEADFQKLMGAPAIGFYRLLISLKIINHFNEEHDSNKGIIKGISGELCLRKPDNVELLICRLHSVKGSSQLTFHRSDPSFQIQLEGDLDSVRISAIENLRLGQDLHLSLNLFTTLVGSKKDDEEQSKTNIMFTATQSDWINVLNRMNYRKVILVELPDPENFSNLGLNNAVIHFENAKDYLTQGNNIEVVAECRKVLELVESVISSSARSPEGVKSQFKNDPSLSKEQRLENVFRALKFVTHLAHHANEDSTIIEWHLVDAQSILSMTSTMLMIADKLNN